MERKKKVVRKATTSSQPLSMSTQEHVSLPPELTKVPTIAFPTVFLCAFSIVAFGLLHYLALTSTSITRMGGWKEQEDTPTSRDTTWNLELRVIAPWTSVEYWSIVAGLTFVTYLAFTPLHDSCHRSVAGAKYSWLNPLVGRISAIPLFLPYGAFVFLHLQHHRFTNEDGYDPDFPVGGKGGVEYATRPWMLPLRCLAIDSGYVDVYLKNWSKRPKMEVLETILGLTFFLIVMTGSSIAFWGRFNYLFWFGYVPAASALAFLAFVFDYLPHRPHRSKELHEATCITAAWGATTPSAVSTTKKGRGGAKGGWNIAVLTPFLLYQNYHLVHHLYPWIPFYQMGRVWWKMADEFIARGSEVKPIFPIFCGVTS